MGPKFVVGIGGNPKKKKKKVKKRGRGHFVKAPQFGMNPIVSGMLLKTF